jgi:hypothetical protein
MAARQAVAAAPARVQSRPKARPRPRPRAAPRRKPQSRGVASGLAWIVVAGVLLAGIVALNVAVLRLNVRLDHFNEQREQLRAGNAALASQLSSRASSPRIQALARVQGFVPAEAVTFVDLGRRAR